MQGRKKKYKIAKYDEGQRKGGEEEKMRRKALEKARRKGSTSLLYSL